MTMFTLTAHYEQLNNVSDAIQRSKTDAKRWGAPVEFLFGKTLYITLPDGTTEKHQQ